LGVGWLYDDKCGCWVYGNAKFKQLYSSVLGVFNYGHYGFLSLDGVDVVDVGAYVGDSAIYFVLRGAEKVLLFSRIQRLIRKCSKILS